MPNTTDTSNVVPLITPTYNDIEGRSDLAVYGPHLDGFDLTPAQRDEFLKMLWIILAGFVDFGYGIHPTQYHSEPEDLDHEIISTVDEYFKDAA